MNRSRAPMFQAAPVLALLALLGAAEPASAETFRWIDERGVVTYSNTPPAAGNQSMGVVPVEERVTVYTPDAQLKQALKSAAERDEKISRLQRELAAERQARQDKRNLAYDRCINERRSDCDPVGTPAVASDPVALTGTAPLYYAPQYVAVAARGNAQRARRIVVHDRSVPIGVDHRPKFGTEHLDRAPIGLPRRDRSSTTIR